MNVRWSRQALADLRGIRAYIAESSPARADAVILRIRAISEVLEQFPEAGRPTRTVGLREIVVARLPYIAQYQIARNVVVIVRIRHGAQRRPE
jgi:toxin ParE1/3/4